MLSKAKKKKHFGSFCKCYSIWEKFQMAERYKICSHASPGWYPLTLFPKMVLKVVIKLLFSLSYQPGTAWEMQSRRVKLSDGEYDAAATDLLSSWTAETVHFINQHRKKYILVTFTKRGKIRAEDTRWAAYLVFF